MKRGRKRVVRAERLRLFIVDDVSKLSLRDEWKKLNDRLAYRAANAAMNQSHVGVMIREAIKNGTPGMYVDRYVHAKIKTAVEKELVRNL